MKTNRTRRLKNCESSDTRNRADEARKRLGVTQEAVDACRKITPLLREAGLTKERVVEILESDGAADSAQFVSRWRQISESDRAYLSLEEICLAVPLETRRLWELICGARLEQSQDATKLIIADSMPRVVANAVKAATEATPILDGQGEVQGWVYGDMKATEFLGKVSGLMPTPKGVSAVFNLPNALPIPVDTHEEDDGIPLPSMDSALKSIQHTITATPQLEAPRQEIPFIQDAEYVEVPLSSPNR